MVTLARPSCYRRGRFEQWAAAALRSRKCPLVEPASLGRISAAHTSLDTLTRHPNSIPWLRPVAHRATYDSNVAAWLVCVRTGITAVSTRTRLTCSRHRVRARYRRAQPRVSPKSSHASTGRRYQRVGTPVTKFSVPLFLTPSHVYLLA